MVDLPMEAHILYEITGNLVTKDDLREVKNELGKRIDGIMVWMRWCVIVGLGLLVGVAIMALKP